MNSVDRHKVGMEVRKQVLGEKRAEQNLSGFENPAMREFFDLTVENVFGAIWARPGLDLKTRSLVVVVSSAATGRTDVLGEHLRMALQQGWSQQELTEVMFQLMAYVGAPLARASLLVSIKTFAEVA